ncbi:PAQR family membrane homeostasis protein TrhA [Agrococcus sp. SGAir0287]|uniref:PAQR family membrane homeostasis protein TrhA n=1 Tax=Agrococcus sp. SGAir0287 TaxID=2070347 RepID=UPI0010CCD882|nr:hemolysin III family protein [Agrococcus sp. SGAir0287]QCR19817.1 hemolysin III [Agrococcus sp. SGAir0287]
MQHDSTRTATAAATPRDLEGASLPHLPIIEAAGDAEAASAHDAKPSWRGWIHLVMGPIALVAGIVLVALADTVAGKVASAVFMATSLLLFGVSATYHRFRWSDRVRMTLKRLDHSNIFLLIAGTYTPLAVLTLSTTQATILLSIVWGGAALGIAFRVLWVTAPRWLYVPLYVALGWAAVMYLPAIWAVSAATAILIAVGGLAYTVGAVFYALKRPNPVPGHFGFHELFHACTVVAFLCHWTAILLVAI